MRNSLITGTASMLFFAHLTGRISSLLVRVNRSQVQRYRHFAPRLQTAPTQTHSGPRSKPAALRSSSHSAEPFTGHFSFAGQRNAQRPRVSIRFRSVRPRITSCSASKTLMFLVSNSPLATDSTFFLSLVAK